MSSEKIERDHKRSGKKNHHMLKQRTIASIITASLLSTSGVILSGCDNPFFGGQQSVANINSATGQTSNGNGNGNVTALATTSYELTEDSVNDFCNGAMKLTVTDVQRRPMSTFSGAQISGGSSGSSSSSSSSVTSASDNSIVLQIDISYTWNQNTYLQAVSKATGQAPSPPSTLKDILQPGTLMYVEGEDADGNLYRSADILVPKKEEDVNQLAINSQWDYDAIDSSLPEASVTKTGSVLMRVASTAKNLKLVMYTPTGGQDVTNKDAVTAGTINMYEMSLS